MTIGIKLRANPVLQPTKKRCTIFGWLSLVVRFFNTMKNILFVFILLSFGVNASEIKPFTTDGCSMFPDGDLQNNSKWIECCTKHDYAYWKGGTREERELADNELKQCVALLGENDISLVMHAGVRLGGEPLYPTWYRWGYGWPYLRGYKELTKEEKAQAQKRLIEFRDFIDQLIEKEK